MARRHDAGAAGDPSAKHHRSSTSTGTTSSQASADEMAEFAHVLLRLGVGVAREPNHHDDDHNDDNNNNNRTNAQCTKDDVSYSGLEEEEGVDNAKPAESKTTTRLPPPSTCGHPNNHRRIESAGVTKTASDTKKKNSQPEIAEATPTNRVAAPSSQELKAELKEGKVNTTNNNYMTRYREPDSASPFPAVVGKKETETEKKRTSSRTHGSGQSEQRKGPVVQPIPSSSRSQGVDVLQERRKGVQAAPATSSTLTQLHVSEEDEPHLQKEVARDLNALHKKKGSSKSSFSLLPPSRPALEQGWTNETMANSKSCSISFLLNPPTPDSPKDHKAQSPATTSSGGAKPTATTSPPLHKVSCTSSSPSSSPKFASPDSHHGAAPIPSKPRTYARKRKAPRVQSTTTTRAPEAIMGTPNTPNERARKRSTHDTEPLRDSFATGEFQFLGESSPVHAVLATRVSTVRPLQVPPPSSSANANVVATPNFASHGAEVARVPNPLLYGGGRPSPDVAAPAFLPSLRSLVAAMNPQAASTNLPSVSAPHAQQLPVLQCHSEVLVAAPLPQPATSAFRPVGRSNTAMLPPDNFRPATNETTRMQDRNPLVSFDARKQPLAISHVPGGRTSPYPNILPYPPYPVAHPPYHTPLPSGGVPTSVGPHHPVTNRVHINDSNDNHSNAAHSDYRSRGIVVHPPLVAVPPRPKHHHPQPRADDYAAALHVPMAVQRGPISHAMASSTYRDAECEHVLRPGFSSSPPLSPNGNGYSGRVAVPSSSSASQSTASGPCAMPHTLELQPIRPAWTQTQRGRGGKEVRQKKARSKDDRTHRPSSKRARTQGPRNNNPATDANSSNKAGFTFHHVRISNGGSIMMVTSDSTRQGRDV